jgi:hypothetical protein
MMTSREYQAIKEKIKDLDNDVFYITVRSHTNEILAEGTPKQFRFEADFVFYEWERINTKITMVPISAIGEISLIAKQGGEQ